MLSFNPEKKNCCGCAACYSVCPKQCISMERDEEGFDYPVLTSPEACIDCKLCELVCPVTNKNTIDLKQKAFAAITKRDFIWRRSASGGAFSEICRAWGDENTLVVGAAWNGFYVHHVGIIGVNNIQPLCNSKYVSSHIEETFREIRNYLKIGKVIFCGTPCQVSGLKSYLRKSYDNLLTIDFICHGVGSPAVFEACMGVTSKQAGEEITAYSFRAKRNVYETDHLTKLVFKNRDEFVIDDAYMQLFLNQTCLRPSCGVNCRYRGRNKRPGDFTIADFKGLTNIFPHLLGSKRNFSTIVCNTEKSKTLIPLLYNQMNMFPVSVEDIIQYNPLFDHNTWNSEGRDVFFKEFAMDAEGTIRRYTKPYKLFIHSLKGELFNVLPVWVRKQILKYKLR